MINLKVLFTSSKYVSVEALKGSWGAKVSVTKPGETLMKYQQNTIHSILAVPNYLISYLCWVLLINYCKQPIYTAP